MGETKHGITTYYRILWLVSSAHFIIDLVSSVVPATFPVLQRDLHLSYVQLGTIVMVQQIVASMLQPLFGVWADRKTRPWFLPAAALMTGVGLAGLGMVNSYFAVLIAVIFLGLGSAMFHPEGSRVAYVAAGARKGLAQSIFQVGGNAGFAVGPLMIPIFFLPFGLKGAYWLLVVALLLFFILLAISKWYGQFRVKRAQSSDDSGSSSRYGALVLLVAVVSMRSWIHSGVSSFLPLYYVNVFGWSLTAAEIHLFIFLFAGAVGTFIGGALSDRYGMKRLLLFSMWGSVPFLFALPYASGIWSYIVVFIVGLICLSSFSVTVVYGHRLMPGKVGLVSGLMIGFAIGMGGIGATVLGGLADLIGLTRLLQLLVILSFIGWAMGIPLPDDKKIQSEPSVST